MNVNIYYPQSNILKQIIDCFYILNRDENEPNSLYLTFPSVNSIVSVALNARLIKDENKIVIKHDLSVPFFSDLTCRFNKPILVEYEGPIKEITIYFKPLGLNALLDRDLSQFANNCGTSFIPLADFEETFLMLFSENSDTDIISLLEKYLISKFKGFEHPYIPLIIDDFYNENNKEKSLAEIFSKYPYSQKTIIQHFEKHICKTPSEFRKILRFRNALSDYKISDNQTFTKLSCYLDFFDQSHMIKEFKTLTGYSPKDFYRKLSQIENGEIKWMFL
jgi:AraC-like DNA-binding protein